MLIVNCTFTGVGILYGVYVYRVLRHAHYYDLVGLKRRTKVDQTNTGATGRRETHPTKDTLNGIEIARDADLYEGTRRIYSGEAAAKLVASVEPDDNDYPPGRPPRKKQN